jgi:ABC-2 type transport system permease protein
MYYKTSFLLNLLSPIVLLAGQYLLWGALYKQQSGEIGTMSRPEMFSYILVAFALSNLLSWSSENTLAREIKQGTVVARCIRPTSFLVQSISEMTGAVLVQGIFNTVIVLIGFLCFGAYLKIPNVTSVLMFIPCVILSILLRMLMIDVFSLFCFFSTGYLGIAWTRNALFDFFSGSLIPVVMFPNWLKTITYYTPFPYMLQVPISVLLGQTLPMKNAQVFLVQIIWILILLVLHCAIYGCARKNMTIAGG